MPVVLNMLKFVYTPLISLHFKFHTPSIIGSLYILHYRHVSPLRLT